MTPEEIVFRWKEIADDIYNVPFRRIEAAQTETLNIPEAEKILLSQWGLPPESCTFRLDLFPPLQRVPEIFAPGDWTVEEQAAVADCYLLGEDGGGNAICFSEPKGEVWLLDHETMFQERQFINSNLSAFAEFLLLFLEGDEGTLTYRQVFERMQNIDFAATQPRTGNNATPYWHRNVLSQIEDEEA